MRLLLFTGMVSAAFTTPSLLSSAVSPTNKQKEKKKEEWREVQSTPE
jgi:hypothetical protein